MTEIDSHEWILISETHFFKNSEANAFRIDSYPDSIGIIGFSGESSGLIPRGS